MDGWNDLNQSYHICGFCNVTTQPIPSNHGCWMVQNSQRMWGVEKQKPTINHVFWFWLRIEISELCAGAATGTYVMQLVPMWCQQWEVWSVGREESSEKCKSFSVCKSFSEVWSVGREECSAKCGVWSVKCGVWRKQWEVWSVGCEVWSVECEVWSVECEVWSVELEECSVKCGVWSVECEKCSEKCGVWSLECEESSEKWEVWSVDCEVWSVECEVWSVECGVWSVKCGVGRVQCEVWSVKCGVWSVKSAVRSVKCEVELQMWHVKQDTTFAGCTQARAWLAHGACKFYRWERYYIYISATLLYKQKIIYIYYFLTYTYI